MWLTEVGVFAGRADGVVVGLEERGWDWYRGDVAVSVMLYAVMQRPVAVCVGGRRRVSSGARQVCDHHCAIRGIMYGAYGGSSEVVCEKANYDVAGLAGATAATKTTRPLRLAGSQARSARHEDILCCAAREGLYGVL